MKSVKEIKGIAREMFLFDGVDLDLLEEEMHFLASCNACQFDDGEIIHSATAPVGGLAYIYRGTASVLSDASDKSVLIRSLDSGDVIGASTLYGKAKGYNTVIRAERCCAVFRIPEEQVRRLIASNSTIAENYIRYLTDRISFLNRKISAFTAGSAEAKLAVYLQNLPRNSDNTVQLSCSLSELADMLNMGRASLYRSLDSMTDQGILLRDGKKITLLDPDALQNIF